MQIKLPLQVSKAIKILEENNFEVFAVGGCVRDSIMGKIPSDWDLCTSAKPDGIKRSFNTYRIIDIGIMYGTVGVIIDNMLMEITTYRLDGEYKDGRHPEKVEFTTDIYEDLSRRDFTINAMAYNPTKGLVDEFGGIDDIQSRLIRAVGQADKRFNEDSLRIIRALRFAAVLDFEIDKETSVSIHKNANLLENVSAERVNTEFSKMILGKGITKILDNYCEVILNIIPKDFISNDYNRAENCEFLGLCVGNATDDLATRLTVFFYKLNITHENDAHSIRELLKALKYETKVICMVEKIFEYAKRSVPTAPSEIKKMLYEMGLSVFYRFIEFKFALLKSGFDNKIDSILSLQKTKYMLKDILRQNECYEIKNLAINGNDLIALGLSGKAVGDMLEYLLALVWEDNSLNNRDNLIEEVQKIIQEK